jgi:flagellar basal body L-ring protein FlgH
MKTKTYFAALLAVLIVLGLFGCASSGKASIKEQDSQISPTALSEQSEEISDAAVVEPATTESSVATVDQGTVSTEPEQRAFNIGDSITVADKCKVKIKKISFKDEVKPKDTSSYYNYYPSDKGEIYIVIDMNVKNISKKDLGYNEIMDVTVDYNNGYTYNGFLVYEGPTGLESYTNLYSISPLESEHFYCLVDCPDEVKKSKAPLRITISIGGEEFVYNMR